MQLENEILQDIKEFGEGSKIKTIQYYMKEMNELCKLYGGNISDIPVVKDHKYWQLRDKLVFLGRLNVPEPVVELPVEEVKENSEVNKVIEEMKNDTSGTVRTDK